MRQGSAVLGVRNGRVSLLAAAIFVVGVGSWLWWWSAYGADLDSIERLVRRRFPTVPQVSTEELVQRLSRQEHRPVVLDVRKREEYELSHLPSARHVDPGTAISKLDPALPKDTPIVTYCSVGYRSSSFAKRLRAAGYTNVQNLEGSIFRWANEDRPLERDGKPTDKVHPYSNYWGRLVKPERRASLPTPK